MKRVSLTLAGTAGAAALTFGVAGTAFGADAISGAVQQQATNWTAIIMFLIFVAGTLGITYWAASKTKTAKDFYSAGGVEVFGRLGLGSGPVGDAQRSRDEQQEHDDRGPVGLGLLDGTGDRVGGQGSAGE